MIGCARAGYRFVSHRNGSVRNTVRVIVRERRFCVDDLGESLGNGIKADVAFGHHQLASLERRASGVGSIGF